VQIRCVGGPTAGRQGEGRPTARVRRFRQGAGQCVTERIGVSTSPGSAKAREENLQAKAEEEIRESFGEELRAARTTAARTNVAKGLFDAAGKSDDPAARYVMLRLARDVAVTEGDPVAFCSLIDEIARYYAIDAMAMKAEAISKAWSSTSTARYRKPLGQHAVKLLEEAMKAQQYAAAEQFVRVALAAARLARDSRSAQELQRISQQIKTALKSGAPEKP
jgi:hypothetical protein